MSKHQVRLTPEQAHQLILWIVDLFPGLVDGQTDVNGGDLVQKFTTYLAETQLQEVIS